ncbi:MAG: DegT/DnrJ/EryC1/StrS family aminotransferase [Candidatus Omnitrophica bacterium]|nr:DegT/DnrJ/EryC1/StrS family aminotransferase [Candidatus Omnitrophota bacterium]
MQIKFLDFEREYGLLNQELNSKILSVINKGSFILGEELSRFESSFASYCGVKYAVGVNSGTDALHLALVSLGIKAQDEVIVPAFTYIATAMAVSYTGARPVFCDINEQDYNINLNDLKKKITSKTKAIIPVHLYGQPAAMPEILKIAREYNLKVIEDSAQAHGAEIYCSDGFKMAGSFSDLGCFSFYPTKNLGCYGDGGMVVTESEDLYNRLLKLRDYGRESKYSHIMLGYNSRLDNIQAAILLVKLKYLDSWNDKRRELAGYYNKALGGISGLRLPLANKNVKHVYHVYVVRAEKRKELIDYLSSNGVPSIIHYPIPCHLQKAYLDAVNKPGLAPVSEKISEEVLSLPLNPFLKTEELDYIISKIKDFY